MQWLGDYKEDDTLYFLWSSNAANGASITRTVNGEVRVYKDNGVSQTTTGVTDTEDFDGLTGVHACTVVLTDAFYVTGADYSVVLQGATIDGQTVNAVLAHFSIENRFKGEVGTDSKFLISTDAQDLSVTLDVNTKLIEGADPTDTIRDSMLDDATRFSGGNIDAAISSRSSHTAANVRAETCLTGDGADSIGKILFDLNARLTAARTGYLDNINNAQLANVPNLTSLTREQLGFPDGRVWFDAALGSAGTAFPIGTATSPSNNVANTKTIADNNNLRSIEIHGAFQLGGAWEHYSFSGHLHEILANKLDLNGQDVDGSNLNNLFVSGAQGGTGDLIADHCFLYQVTNFNGVACCCDLYGSAMSIKDGGTVDLTDCNAIHSTLTLTLNAPTRFSLKSGKGNCTLTTQDGGTAFVRGFEGTLIIASMTGGTLTIYGDSGTDITINATSTAGTINIYGDCNVTDSSGAGCTVNDYTIYARTKGLDDIHDDLVVVLADVTGIAGDAMRGTNNAALAATALSTTQWTNARAGYLDNIDNANLATIPNISTISAARIGYLDNINQAGLLQLTAARAGYLDNINNANLSTIPNISTLSAARIGYLDNINNVNLSTIADISTLTATEIAYLDAAITSRSSHTTNNVRDAILSDSTPFNGADITAILTDTGTTLETHLIEIKGTGFIFDTHSLVQCAAAAVGGGTLANQTTIISHLTDIKGLTWSDETLVAIYNAAKKVFIKAGKI